MKYIITRGVLILALALCCWGTCFRKRQEHINYRIRTRYLGLEERIYPATTWISTLVQQIPMEDAIFKMLPKLTRYFQGYNDRAEKINSTIPAKMQVIPCFGARCEPTLIMSLLIPPQLAEKAPPAVDKDLFFEKDGKKIYVVSKFPGWAEKYEWQHHAEVMKQLLKNDGRIDKSSYHIVWYYSLNQVFDQCQLINEIWMTKRPAPPRIRSRLYFRKR